MIRIDYLGFRYDDTAPSFIVLPHPPHPAEGDGSVKFVYHRPAKKMYDWDDLLDNMENDGYIVGSNELGYNHEWLRQNLGMKIPYDFTLTEIPAKMRPDDVSFMLSGPAVATERVRVGFSPLEVDGTPIPYPAFVNRNVGFWTFPGQTLTQFRQTLNAMDDSNVAYAGVPPTTTPEIMRYVMQCSIGAALEYRAWAQGWGGQFTHANVPHYLPPGWHVTGVNMVWNGVPPPPPIKFNHFLSIDRKSVIYEVTGGPVPVRVVGGTIVELYGAAVDDNGTKILAAGSVESALLRTTLDIGLDNNSIANAMVTWLNNYVPYVYGTANLSAFKFKAARIEDKDGVKRFQLTLHDKVDDAIQTLLYAPRFNCY